MFMNFFYELKKAKVPVSLREYLTLMEGMEAGVPAFRIDDFYYMSRCILVKDEKHLDKFDRVFGEVFKGIDNRTQQVKVPAFSALFPILAFLALFRNRQDPDPSY